MNLFWCHGTEVRSFIDWPLPQALSHNYSRVSKKQGRFWVEGFLFGLVYQPHYWKSGLVQKIDGLDSTSSIARSPPRAMLIRSTRFHCFMFPHHPPPMPTYSRCFSPYCLTLLFLQHGPFCSHLHPTQVHTQTHTQKFLGGEINLNIEDQKQPTPQKHNTKTKKKQRRGKKFLLKNVFLLDRHSSQLILKELNSILLKYIHL